jgi:purine-nucleoside phosphorylase
MRMARKVEEAARWVRAHGGGEPVARALALESHMTGFSNELSRVRVLPLRKVPHHPELAGGRGGALLLGWLGGVGTAVLEGRAHLYEGALPGETGLPVRLLAALGAQSVVFVADARSLAPRGENGGVLLAVDRIDLSGAGALRGSAEAARGGGIDVPPAPGPVRERAAAAARAAGVTLGEGVAALVPGPVWPTRAEERMLRGFGADAVTMGLAPELAVAAALGLETATFLLIDGTPWGKPHLDFLRAFIEAS